MAIINSIQNTANIVYGGQTINSNAVSTLLLLPPTILKAVDKLTAKIGDTLLYTITITNVSLSDISSIAFSDTIAAGATYVADSFTVNGTKATPTVNSQIISYTIPTIAAAGIATIKFNVTVVGGSN
ncbi:MAG: DUF11 domain-containing protein [Beduini sp.]|uniref:DUF11 domain-containing protein n=1 Tax=Beduini sp. TaxID=1922300 RepID=UPI0011CA3C45